MMQKMFGRVIGFLAGFSMLTGASSDVNTVTTMKMFSESSTKLKGS
jgi:hypothetical protein